MLHRSSEAKILRVKLQLFSYPAIQTYVLVAQKNCLIEMFFEYPQHMFWLRNKKNNFQLRTFIWRPGVILSELCYKGTNLQRNHLHGHFPTIPL